MYPKLFSTISLAVFLTACGGGGGGAPATTPAPTPTTPTTPSITGSLIINGVIPPATGSTRSLTAVSDSASSVLKGEYGPPPVSKEVDGLRVGQGIISLHREFQSDGRAALLEIMNRHPELAMEAKSEVTPEGPFLVTFDGADSAEATHRVLEILQSDPAVSAAEAVRMYQARQMRTTLEPNDPSYPNQRWQYNMIGLPQAWTVTTGSPNVCVAVIDDGIYPQHPDLMANLLPGLDVVSGDTDPTAAPPTPRGENDHGTHVAGTVAAVGNNRIGVTGVSWRNRIVPIRGLPGSNMQLAIAIRWAAGLPVTGVPNNPNACRVINMSLGGLQAPQCQDAPSPVLQGAIDAAEAAGVVIVAAAGNEGQQCPAPQSSSPANQTNVIAVAALGRNGQRAPYSNQAPTNFISAPGGSGLGVAASDVLSTAFVEAGAPRAPSYESFPGTSMASPHVAGVVALMLSANPNLTPAQVRNIIMMTAQDLGAAGRDNIYGHGLIRADRAVRMAANTQPPAGPVMAAVPSAVQLNGNQTMRTIAVSNRGGGNVTFQAGAESEQTGGNWLTATFPAAGSAPPYNINITANRAGLQPGSYRGRVVVTTSAGRTVIPVTLAVPGAVNIGNVTVSLLNPETGATVASTTTNAAAGYRYSMTGFPAGQYLIAAQSAAAGVTRYRGGFPSLNESKPITINGPTTLAGFPVNRERSVNQRGATGVAIAGEVLAGVYETGLGEPIANATVTIQGVGSAQTDVSGEAAFASVAGPVTITASAPGYSTMTFAGINSEYIEFELEPTGAFGGEVSLDVVVNGLDAGAFETGIVSAIVDGEIEDVATVAVGQPMATLSVTRGRELSVGLVVNSQILIPPGIFLPGPVTKFNIEDLDPIFESSAVTIEALVAPAVSTTMGTIMGAGTFAQGGQTYTAAALAFDDANAEYVLGGVFNTGIAQPYTLSRAGLGAELDALVEGQIIVFAEDANGNSSESSTYGLLSQLPADFSTTLRAAPTLTSPVANETGVAATPTFSFTLDGGASLGVIVIEGPDEFLWEVFVPPGTTSFQVPALDNGGLVAGATYQWSVEDYVIPDFELNEFILDYGDFSTSATETGVRAFTVAP